MNTCTICFPWLNGMVPSPNVGSSFPSDAWEVITSEDFPVGPIGDVVMRGTAKCRGCGYIAAFDCRYPDGYYFPEGENFLQNVWNDAVDGKK